jgi:hypothetical protein
VPAQEPTGQQRALGAVGVGPMRIGLPERPGVHLSSRLTIAVTLDAASMEHHFAFVPVLANVPAALWAELGADLRPEPNTEALVRDVLVGFEIRPRLSPIEGTDRASAGGLQLVQYHLPALPGGPYRVTVTQDVTTDEPATVKDADRKIPPQHFSSVGEIMVAGVRQTVDVDEVYAVYPPDNGLGDYSADLPHVILNHSTLPWQEKADPGREDLPWLALLLFDESDVPVPQIVTVAEIRDLPGVGDSLPDGDKVSVIDVLAGHLRQLLPAQDAERRDLALLAHVRRDPDGTERAVIIGNRLPRAGANHVAHLVSVRNRYGPAGPDLDGAADDAPVRLVSLKSWGFTSTITEQGLTALLHRIAAGSGPLQSPSATGYLDPHGNRSMAVYQSPLAPRPRQDRPALPARSATELSPIGSTDLTFAAAWQLGQLLALQSKPFAAALYRWKRLRAQRRKAGDGTVPPVPATVTGWLDELALLHGVPFNYLVPDEGMAPIESLRFFSLYEGWIAALLDGALSIGRVTLADYRLDRTLAADLSASGAGAPWTKHLLASTVAPTPSGFLLRSHAVAGWPDLRVVATDEHGATVDPLRTELLSDNTLLCLFIGEISALTISQPEHTLHLTLGDAAAGWQTGNRVVDITAVARTRIGVDATAQGASAQFAAHMLATPSRVDIVRP